MKTKTGLVVGIWNSRYGFGYRVVVCKGKKQVEVGHYETQEDARIIALACKYRFDREQPNLSFVSESEREQMSRIGNDPVFDLITEKLEGRKRTSSLVEHSSFKQRVLSCLRAGRAYESVRVTELMWTYVRVCRVEGVLPIFATPHSFSKALETVGFVLDRRGARTVWLSGYVLAEDT